MRYTGRRQEAGTPNMLGIVRYGKAAELAFIEMPSVQTIYGS